MISTGVITLAASIIQTINIRPMWASIYRKDVCTLLAVFNMERCCGRSNTDSVPQRNNPNPNPNPNRNHNANPNPQNKLFQILLTEE